MKWQVRKKKEDKDNIALKYHTNEKNNKCGFKQNKKIIERDPV
jgi:hypothetical protein